MYEVLTVVSSEASYTSQPLTHWSSKPTLYLHPHHRCFVIFLYFIFYNSRRSISKQLADELPGSQFARYSDIQYPRLDLHGRVTSYLNGLLKNIIYSMSSRDVMVQNCGTYLWHHYISFPKSVTYESRFSECTATLTPQKLNYNNSFSDYYIKWIRLVFCTLAHDFAVTELR